MSGFPSSPSRIPILREDMAQPLNLESGSRPDLLSNIPEPELPSSETPPPLGLRSDQGLDLNLPTHPDSSDLSHIRQEPQEIIHHYWARFLLVMSKVKDCREEEQFHSFAKTARTRES